MEESKFITIDSKRAYKHIKMQKEGVFSRLGNVVFHRDSLFPSTVIKMKPVNAGVMMSN